MKFLSIGYNPNKNKNNLESINATYGNNPTTLTPIWKIFDVD